ncbi:3-hydroxyacyl-CoA dehydrogenase [bacterium]|nr:3-hydroxyacyl-CoA dehydrogenase [bacterium]
MLIKDRVFLVTGGASGLGEATVRMLVEQGARVVVADFNPEKGAKLSADLGSSIAFALTDVSDESAVKGAIALASEKFGGLHGLINCAGIGTAMRVVGKYGPHSLGDFEMVIKVNLIGTFNCIRLAGEAMSKSAPQENGERGVIVNTASVAAFDGQIGQAAYSASKGGVVAMTLPIAREFAQFGIRVCTIAPGLFDTPLFAALPDPARQALGASIPFPSRLGYPSEYALLVRQIIENPMLNGETIRIDGALRMAPK